MNIESTHSQTTVMKVEINFKKMMEKTSNICKPSKTLLNIHWIKKEMKKKEDTLKLIRRKEQAIRKYGIQQKLYYRRQEFILHSIISIAIHNITNSLIAYKQVYPQ